ncbi:MAG: HAD-IIA family hydrolase [Bacilli bacterium]
MNLFKDIQLFLLDMDGTLNFEDQLIPGAKEFIKTLMDHNKQYVYLTNNSSKCGKDYVQKMRRLGLSCDDHQVFTSGMAMGLFLSSERKDKTVYLVGTKALKCELLSYGIHLIDEKPDIVVVGFDRELQYKKLELACEFLSEGAEFLATNVDKVCPIQNGRYIPDCGCMCDMLEIATKKKARYIGKPNREMIDILAKEYKLENHQIAMVGDRIYTDIATAINAQARSILVLSGETKLEDVKNSSLKPDHIFESVNELKDYFN